MTNRIFTYREGTTEPITINLYDNDEHANISGYTAVSIFLRSADGSEQSEATSTDGGGITVTDRTNGIITLDPSKLTKALKYGQVMYSGYIIVTDGANKRTSFPSDGEFTINMLERYSGDG